MSTCLVFKKKKNQTENQPTLLIKCHNIYQLAWGQEVTSSGFFRFQNRTLVAQKEILRISLHSGSRSCAFPKGENRPPANNDILFEKCRAVVRARWEFYHQDGSAGFLEEKWANWPQKQHSNKLGGSIPWAREVLPGKIRGLGEVWLLEGPKRELAWGYPLTKGPRQLVKDLG